MSARTFRLRMSERCFRFKPDALPSHAPRKTGVYEFVTFDAKMNPQVLYVGLAGAGQTVFDALAQHMMGNRRPASEDLFKAAKDVYFDYVAEWDGDDEDLKDIAAALIAKHKPRLNPSSPPPVSGRYEAVTLEEVG
ncbi:MAG: GIY-YIG nuclease family protein [Elusimicrobia bacterium]|nr:GIY-YIG nuclease family protein [Elusimicrobiota bacterium]